MFQYRFDDLLVLNKADNPHLPLAFWAGKGVHFVDLLNQLGVGRVPTIDPPAYFFSFVRTSSVLQTALAIMRKLVNAAR